MEISLALNVYGMRIYVNAKITVHFTDLIFAVRFFLTICFVRFIRVVENVFVVIVNFIFNPLVLCACHDFTVLILIRFSFKFPDPFAVGNSHYAWPCVHANYSC